MKKFLVLWAIAVICVLPVTASGADYTVGTGGTYATIKAALEDATVLADTDITLKIMTNITEADVVMIPPAAFTGTTTFKIKIQGDTTAKTITPKTTYGMNAANLVKSIETIWKISKIGAASLVPE